MLLQSGCKSMFFCISSASSICLRLLSEREHSSMHDNQSDSDMRFGWFQHRGIAALMPKPTCRFWKGISLPNFFPLTGSSTPVPSGNGGGENCISIRATIWRAHRNQTGGLQGLYNVSCDGLADNGLGPGSDWQEKCWSSLMQPFSKKACVTATAQCTP
jgi:hypothetical protein